MHKHIKRLFCGLLTTALLAGSLAAVDFSAVAAEIEGTDTTASEAYEAVPVVLPDAATIKLSATSCHAESVGSYEMAEEEPSEPATQEPTQAPTQPAPVVGKAENLARADYEKNQVTLTWDKASGATAYELYICNADKTTQYTRLDDVKTNTVKLTGLTSTTQYNFKLVPYAEVDGVRYYGEATTLKTATKPIEVSDLTLTRSEGRVEFSWTKIGKADGYKIYRAYSGTNGNYVLYKDIKNNSTTSFTDTGSNNGNTYYYKIYAYRYYPSINNTYHATAKSLNAVCGMGSTKVNATARLYKVHMSWTKVSYATGYNIYYSTNNRDYKKLGSTTGLSYITPRFNKGAEYYFKVVPYRVVGSKKVVVESTAKVFYREITNAINGIGVGNTYIEISKNKQHMWMYIDGKLYEETDVVTGNYGTADTPSGVYNIFQRVRNTTLVGTGYTSFVKYWLGFTYNGCGIHDASWRSSYGGSIYKGNGSHGCVNTPESKVSRIYAKAYIGMPVIVYQ